MSDFLSSIQAGDRNQKAQAFEPSDLPGFMHPKGNKKVYIPEDQPGVQLTREEAMAMHKKAGGSPLYPEMN